QGAPGPAGAARRGGDPQLAATPSVAREGAGEGCPVPEQEWDAADEPECRPPAGEVPGPGGPRPADQPAHAPAQFRDPPARRRGGHPQRPGVARPPQLDDHADLHARNDPASARQLSPGPPEGLNLMEGVRTRCRPLPWLALLLALASEAALHGQAASWRTD